MVNCSYCKETGHNIKKCNSPRACNLVTNATQAADVGVEYLKTFVNRCSNDDIRLLTVKCGGKISGANDLVKRQVIMMFYFEDWNTSCPRRRLTTEPLARVSSVAHVAPVAPVAVINTEVINEHAQRYLRLVIDFIDMRTTHPYSAMLIYRDEISRMISFMDANPRVRDRFHELRAIHEASFWSEVEVKRAQSIVLSQQSCNRVESKEVQCCNICYDDVKKTNMVTLNCAHEFCTTCIESTLKNVPNRKSPSCAMCRAEMTKFQVHSANAFKHMQKVLKH